MVRVSLLLFLFLISPFYVSAQSFQAGVTGGLSTTQISGDSQSGFHKVGLIFGGFVSTRISDAFDGSLQIMYIQKGSKKNAKPEKNDFTAYLLRLNYIEVPILLQWMYSEKFWFETGPTFGVLLSQHEENEIGDIPEPRKFNDFELGFAAGMNVRLIKDLIFNARFTSSIIPVRKHQSGETDRINGGQYNAVLAFTLNYQFGSKKSR